MKTVLFICTGNYYRSRFAEHFFNHVAVEQGLGWRADSRGLQAVDGRNFGVLSAYAVAGMRAFKVPVPSKPRDPAQLTEADLRAADLIIALKEAEHRSMLAEEFPEWEDRVEYWHIDDLDCSLPEDALRCLRSEVLALVARLREAEQGSDAA
jgi:protein-tyrosine phosphatase